MPELFGCHVGDGRQGREDGEVSQVSGGFLDSGAGARQLSGTPSDARTVPASAPRGAAEGDASDSAADGCGGNQSLSRLPGKADGGPVERGHGRVLPLLPDRIQGGKGRGVGRSATPAAEGECD